MALVFGWFLCGYDETVNGRGSKTRTCQMNRFTTQIIDTDGGNWSETEILNGYTVVKVKAQQTTLDTIASTPGFTFLCTVFSDLINLDDAQLAGLQGWITSQLGIPLGTYQAHFGANNIAIRTHAFQELFDFLALQPRKSPIFSGGKITYTGLDVVCRSVESVDAEVI